MTKLLVPEKVPLTRRRVLGRSRTTDTSYTFRMTAGAAGDISRAHPASVQPCLGDPNSFPTAYGQPVVVDAGTQGVRPIAAGDAGAVVIWGVTCRPYPIQQSTTSNNYGEVNYGSIAPPNAQPIDVMRAGYMMVAVNGATLKGGAVFVWYGVTGGGHTLSGFEAAAGATTLALSSNYVWNSPPDTNGIAELAILM